MRRQRYFRLIGFGSGIVIIKLQNCPLVKNFFPPVEEKLCRIFYAPEGEGVTPENSPKNEGILAS